MPQYDFYAAILRFVASTATRTDPRVTAMMENLECAAKAIEESDSFAVIEDQREICARALAGVAAFLQERILPETIADQNIEAETQVRWAVDASLDALNQILRAQAQGVQDTIAIVLMPPPIMPTSGMPQETPDHP